MGIITIACLKLKALTSAKKIKNKMKKPLASVFTLDLS